MVLCFGGANVLPHQKSGPRAYVQVVENNRVDGAVRQSVIANLGRADDLIASGALASLLASGAKLTDQVFLVSALDEDADGSLSVAAKRIGGPLLLANLGRRHRRRARRVAEAPCIRVRSRARCLRRHAAPAFCFRVGSRLLVLDGGLRYSRHRGSRPPSFLSGYGVARRGIGGEAGGALAPRCVKDVIEEKLFDRRRDLFTDLSAVFMDTTSLSFYGEGGETLGEHGYSKDFRPDLKQMILGLVVDGSGSPICTEMWPGNTADVTVLLPVIDRLRQRFGIGRVCIVADRGMISAETIAGLEQRKLDYILGARERSDALVRKIVLANEGPFVPLLIERRRGETQLFAKEVKVEGKRYIVCRNEAEAEKDRKDREAIVTALDAQLKRGDKALVRNSAYRRYLRKTTDGPAFAIDAGKLAEEARFDGVFVLRTNAKITPLQAVLRYRDCSRSKTLFLRTKAVMRTRPIFHSSDAAIRGHVFCSFLALAMQKCLEDLSRQAGIVPEWKTLLRDLDRLQHVRIRHRDHDWLVRTDASKPIADLFCHAHIALPPRAKQIAPPKLAPPTKSARKRLGRPRRGATPA